MFSPFFVILLFSVYTYFPLQQHTFENSLYKSQKFL